MGAACCKEEAIDFTSEIELSHFHLLRSVGKGAFGKVRVVQHKKTKEIYALKYINKAKCIRMRAVENIIQERRLLEEVEFSLICNLRYAFQDDENLFMVLDLMLGGDLRFHLERAGPMREDVVRFYVAELALALNSLHARRIIHRDLKPDNVLLDEHGHAHLTDFNIAVYFNPSKPLLSIAGSMAYMAPEVLMRKGYLESVDWWSLGVVMFELLFGKRPFRGKSNELLTNSILRDPLPFPDNVDDMVSASCLDVLSKLCERDISKRLGCTPDGIEAFKKHPWFHGIEWDKLVTKEATPPFEPDSKRANFDATHELEELLMEDNPLKAKKRAQTTPETELSAEMQMMEDKFIVYDYTKVKRSQSFSRPLSGTKSLLRSASAGHGHGTLQHDRKLSLSSTTLDGVLLTRSSSGRLDSMPMKAVAVGAQPPPPKVFRPDSPSDLVGQRRFNPDEDQLSLSGTSDQTSSSVVKDPSQIRGQLQRPQGPFSSAEAEKAALHQQLQKPFTDSPALFLSNVSVATHSLKQKSSRDNLSDVSLTTVNASTSQPLSTQPCSIAPSSGRTKYADSISPSSPTNSSGYSNLSSPPTTYNNSPATHKADGTATPHSGSHNVLFSTPEPSKNNGGMEDTSPLDAVAVPPVTVRARVLKKHNGREPSVSLNPKGGRAFELSAQALQERGGGGGYGGGASSRPMSAYTTSNAGSIHESQDIKSMTMGYSHQHPFRASISGIEGLAGLTNEGSLFEPSAGTSISKAEGGLGDAVVEKPRGLVEEQRD
ncbi:hypothetical protein BGZ70_000940 [Mortierella alpina]|uniref:Uncharacterized protein n=1 Tax=Mortierella alpina TaxID=64518 RepID=A0A9P6IWU2_MORAP|nr:hypothetical protein BGZ70_000940 [Mortierella alpina]